MRLVMVVALLAGVLSVGAMGTAGAAPVRDGKSQFTAAASCWEIKQVAPSSPSGRYWLVTPALVAPQQFFCDMVTDGGGWVLVGRGREGWRREYEGLRAGSVAGTVDGTAAFRAAQLHSRTIDGLLNNTPVSALADGVRLKRATNTSGTSWQEVRFIPRTMGRWSWAFGAELPLGAWRFGSTTGSGGLSRSFGTDTAYNRVDWTARKEQGYNRGWSFGAGGKGSPASSSYIWSSTEGGGYAFPFTQAWIRPKLMTSAMTYPAIPAAGTAAQAMRQQHASGALPQPWGVTGLGEPVDGELYVEVSAFTQIGSRVYVGGNFKSVQKGAAAAGSDRVEQSFLAAFDVNTGEFDRNFRPKLNGRVKALAALPDGTLVAGGHFTSVNGASAPALVGLNPTTGATSTTWKPRVENRVTGGLAAVRGLDVRGGYVYAAGAFTHISGVSARNGARLSATTGAVDSGWNPGFDGTVWGVHASPQGDRVYFAGYFTLSNGQPANKAALISNAAGAKVIPFTFVGSDSTRTNYQFTATENSGRFYFGGSEHSIFGYDRSTLERKTGNITKGGGDFQTSMSWRDVVYAGCHCDDWNYSGTYTWGGAQKATAVDKIGFVAAWDAPTGKVLPDFNPIMKGRKGYGAWATFVDSANRLWIGGDYVTAVTATGANQWVGGFARFPMADSVPPAAPSGLTGSAGYGGVVLTWRASEAGAVYEVLQEDRVVATTTATSITVPAAGTSTRFFVRARDAAGNRSASTAAVSASGTAAGTPTGGEAAAPAGGGAAAPAGGGGVVPAGGLLLAENAQFAYRWSTEPLAADWAAPAFDDGAWSRGAGPVGYGSGLVGTDLAAGGFPATRPLSIQGRATFQVADPAAVGALTVTTYADDGVAVYVNGTEVGRSNLGTAAVTQNTYATAAPRTSTARTVPVTFTVPAGLLRAGANVLAVQASANSRSTPDLAFAVSVSSAPSAG